uniref:Uncharacterized protein n=1 Tax=Arundo donax TaxID=35708 RepID=A0A0A9E5F1_ARUDO
MVQAMGRPPL